MKVGDIITDGCGTRGRVTRIDYIPSTGRGVPDREDIYVYWFIPNDDWSPREKNMAYNETPT